MTTLKTAILIPCYNEEKAIGPLVKDLQKQLPQADIYVYDNNSKDQTSKEAKKAGAIVRFEGRQGKGHVVRRMFSDIDADIYVMLDGDNTYDVPSIPKLVDILINQQMDMVIGTRIPDEGAHRPGHALGNILFNFVLKLAFNSPFTDIFSGFRVFSKRFVKSFPALTHGFDVETELSVHSLELGLAVTEAPTPFHERTIGTASKLSTFKDGFKILLRMLILLCDVRPLFLFGILALCFAAAGIILGLPVITHYLETGLVPRLPTAMLSGFLVVLGFFNFYVGLILNNISRSKRELKKLFFLKD